MMQRVRLAPILVVLAILIAVPQGRAQGNSAATAKYGFSILFPKPPSEKTEKDDKAVYHYFSLFDDHVMYQAAYTEAFDPLAESELVDAVNSVAKGAEGRVLSSEPTRFNFGGRNLAARTFSAENKGFVMTGKFFIDGKQLYGILVAVEHGFDRQAAADRFLQSMKSASPAR